METIADVQRRQDLLDFGFGTDVMKRTTVCPNCRSMENSGNSLCSKCGAALTGPTLYEYYRTQHKSCPDCGSVLSDFMDFCPKCGRSLKEDCKL